MDKWYWVLLLCISIAAILFVLYQGSHTTEAFNE